MSPGRPGSEISLGAIVERAEVGHEVIDHRPGRSTPTFASGPGAAAILGTHDHTDLFDLLQGRRRR
jgi:alkaline phosphatase